MRKTITAMGLGITLMAGGCGGSDNTAEANAERPALIQKSCMEAAYKPSSVTTEHASKWIVNECSVIGETEFVVGDNGEATIYAMSFGNIATGRELECLFVKNERHDAGGSMTCDWEGYNKQ